MKIKIILSHPPKYLYYLIKSESNKILRLIASVEREGGLSLRYSAL